jgi:hypothetical protein
MDMFVFSRRARLETGTMRAGLQHAVEMTERVNRIAGLGTGLYSQILSPELGTIAWTSFVPDLPTLVTAGDKLTVDDDYMTAVEQGSQFFTGGIDDLLAEIVHGEPDPSRDIQYATVTNAVLASGQLQNGVAVGIEIAQKAEQASGNPVLFALGATGGYGHVSWLSGVSSIEEVEANRAAINSDPAFLDLLDKKGSIAFAEEAELTTQTIHRKLA